MKDYYKQNSKKFKLYETDKCSNRFKLLKLEKENPNNSIYIFTKLN